MKKADGIFLVFDLSQKSSFDNLKLWIDLLKYIKEINANNIILLGNKKDLSEIREVEEDDINIFIKNNGNLKYLEISSKNNEDIDEAFDEMI